MLRLGTRSTHFTSRDLPESVEPAGYLRLPPAEWERWLDDLGIPDGTPYLLSPTFAYDVHLNSYGCSSSAGTG